MPTSSSALADAETDTNELRDAYRPRRVKSLFVGESSPAQGTHFYRADSNLFRATQAAFAEALGKEAVPSGEAFHRGGSSGGDRACRCQETRGAHPELPAPTMARRIRPRSSRLHPHADRGALTS